MQSYSASHERDEARFMNSGMRRGLLAILLCPIPLLSQILAISSYMREATRLSVKHRARLFFGTLISVVSLIVTITALFGELYIYTKRPDVVETVREKARSIFLSDAEEDYGAEGEYYDMNAYTDEMDDDVPDAYSTNDEDWVVDENGEWVYVGEDLDAGDEDPGDFEEEFDFDEASENEYDAEFDDFSDETAEFDESVG